MCARAQIHKYAMMFYSDTPDCCEDPQVGFTFKFYLLKLLDLL